MNFVFGYKQKEYKYSETTRSLEAHQNAKQKKLDAEAEVKRIQEELEGLNIDSERNAYNADYDWYHN